MADETPTPTYQFDSKYKFSPDDWFSGNIPLWNEIFTQFNFVPTNVLEIGCYEGRATVWFSENVIGNNKCNYDVVDWFAGSPSESGMANAVEGLKINSNFIEDNFRHNIAFFPNINFKIYKGMSNKVLPLLLGNAETYDFIYVDASHKADDTCVDAYYAHRLLKSGGLIIFDDYGWGDPIDPSPENAPKMGVDFFYTFYKNLYDIVYVGYQICLRKK